jgi:hypothetical protein
LVAVIWKTSTAKLLTSDRKLQKQRLQLKKKMGSTTGKEVFCGLETKHDRRMVPRQKFFASARKLQKQRPQCNKSVLGSSASDDVFSSLKTIQDRIMQ